MENKNTIIAAKILSGLFNPFMLPFISFLILFLFTYLRVITTWEYKLWILGIVYCFTILMPVLTIYLFRKINGFNIKEMEDRRRGYIPYLLTIIAYLFCLLLLYRLSTPYYMTGIIVACLLMLFAGLIISLKWKISEHMMGIGGLIGGLISFGFVFNYNPIGWLCFLILVAGALGTARIVVGRHSVGQVLTGFLIGFCSAVLGILYI